MYGTGVGDGVRARGACSFTAELYLWALSNEDTRTQTKLADALSARLKDIRRTVLLEAAVAESSGDQPEEALQPACAIY